MPRKPERKPNQNSTSVRIWKTSKLKLKRIRAVTRHNVVTAIDDAIDHELDRLGLNQPEAPQAAASESET